jgi:hypothetical protein
LEEIANEKLLSKSTKFLSFEDWRLLTTEGCIKFFEMIDDQDVSIFALSLKNTRISDHFIYLAFKEKKFTHLS